jgi:hypothetical protein
MLKKSLSDLSTTLLSVKDSMIGKANEIDDQIEISALITSYSMAEDTTKLFKKTYVLYEIKLYTPYKTWIIHKRYNDFIQLREQLDSKGVKNIPKLPPKLIFTNEEKLSERQLGLEEFINDLFRNVNIIRYPIIMDFIECPQEVFDIFAYNMDCLNLSNLNSSIINNSKKINSNYYNGRITTNCNNNININSDNIDNNNFYCSMAQLKLNNNNININTKYEIGNEDSFEEEISPGTLVIQEFLRNLMDISFNKTELLFQFEYFLKNKTNNEKNKNNKWFYLEINEIGIFFNGFYSSISHARINGFLYHCGNIHNNKIGTQKCLEFLNKILSEDFNPQADTFLKIFRRCSLENIIQMELENHIIDNSNSNRINSFMILYKYVGSGKLMKNKIKRILMNAKAEELFSNWFENQDF